VSKLPAFQFYPGDWRKDPDLSRCSKAAKGVWIDMLSLMFECPIRGVFADDEGKPWSDREIAEAIGGDTATNLECIVELLAKKVARRNDRGAIFSRRQVRDEATRQAGKKRVTKHRSNADVTLDVTPDVTPMKQRSSSSVSSSTTKLKPKPSAAPSACGAEVSKALGESRHKRIQGAIFNAYRHNNGVDPPWDGGEAAQLSKLLRATPGWHDGQIVRCLVNMYDSAGFAKGTRPREFLPRLPKYLHGPLNEFNREQSNGTGNTTSKAEQRNRQEIGRAHV